MIPQTMLGQAFPPAMPNFAGPQSKLDSTLYIGNLHPEAVEEQLFDIFHKYGMVQSLRIMKNTYTRESRGFGFVTFNDAKEARLAQESLNGMSFFHREMRVYFKKNTKIFPKDANLIIRNLDKSITTRNLTAECKRFGDLHSCWVQKGLNEKSGNEEYSLGYAYVQFETKEAADNFKEEFNGKILNGQAITVENFQPEKQRGKKEIKNLYINNFPATWDKERIEKFLETEFGKFGPITSKGVYLHEKSGKFSAFTAFEELEHAEEAMKKMNDTELDGTKLLVVKVIPKRERQQNLMRERDGLSSMTNVYIKFIKMEVKEEDMRKAFEAIGTVTSVFLKEWVPSPKNTNEKPVAVFQFGFVNFLNSEDAQQAILTHLKNPAIRELVQIEGETKFVFYAQTKNTRKQYLSMQKRQQQSIRQNFMPFPHQGRPFKGNKGPRMNQGNPMNDPNFFQGNMNGMFPAMPPTGVMPLPTMPQNAMVSQMPTVKAMDMNMPMDYKKVAEEFRNSKEEFLALSSDEQKNKLGNIMYSRVKSIQKDETLIPKITGMLIDTEVLEFEEILKIIEEDNILKERIEEAIEVINDNNEGQDEDQKDEDEDN